VLIAPRSTVTGRVAEQRARSLGADASLVASTYVKYRFVVPEYCTEFGQQLKVRRGDVVAAH
jgi:hypothetical protein